MTLHAEVRPPCDPTLTEVREAAAALVAALEEHSAALAALPAGPTSFTRLETIHRPARAAVARWDRAVLAHVGSLPVAVDDPWGEVGDEDLLD